MWKAYRQVPLSPRQQNTNIVQYWDKNKEEWQFAKAKVLVFGLSGSVVNFNRVPVLFVAALRRILCVAAQHFFDDFRVLEPIVSASSADFFFLQLASRLGIKFD